MARRQDFDRWDGFGVCAWGLIPAWSAGGTFHALTDDEIVDTHAM